MNRHLLALQRTEIVQSMTLRDGWTFKDGSLGDNSTVLIFFPSGKTAYQLRHGRPANRNPPRVVGVGSDAPRAFSEGTGLYDKVLTYNADYNDLGVKLYLKENLKIVVSDFGFRDSIADR